MANNQENKPTVVNPPADTPEMTPEQLAAKVEADRLEALAAEKSLGAIFVQLTSAQVQAVKLMDKLDDRNKIAQGAIDARIKGAFKAYADKAEASLAKVYDDASRRGFKIDKDKATWIAEYMKEVKSVSVEL